MSDTLSGQTAGQPEVYPSSPPASVSAERLALLQPQLQVLLAGLRELDALVPADTEPAFTPRDCFGEGDDAR